MVHDELAMLTVGQVAEVLQLSQRTVWRMATIGQLPPGIHVGRSVRWPKARIEQWIQEKAIEADRVQSRRKKII